MEAHRRSAGADHVELLRRWILGVLVLGLVGTVTELILLGHYEQPLQLVPVILIVMAVFVGGVLISLYLPIFSLGANIH